jgi:hydroxymethylglutaryl-CoA synthase
MGFTEEQIAPGAVVDRIGNTYSGASLLGLAAILDVAAAGERIFFCSYGSGAGSDAMSLVATARLAAARGAAPAVRDHLERRHAIQDYGEYLRMTRAIRLL